MTIGSGKFHFLTNLEYRPEPMTEREARNLVIAELSGIWTETTISGVTLLASILDKAVCNDGLTHEDAHGLLRYCGTPGALGTVEADLAAWRLRFEAP